jgi:hypothetical protein
MHASSFIETLVAEGPHPSLGDQARTYNRLIGSWVGHAENHMGGQGVREGSIEAHFAWVLEGRAVQDVWITPARGDREQPASHGLNWYGSTLRVFDPSSQAWRTTWTDPVSRLRIELVGRSQGEDIVQIGTRDDRPIRWMFFDIKPESFAWQGHISNDDGKTWDLEVAIRFLRSRD